MASFCFSREFRAHRHFPTTQPERSRGRRLLMLSVQHLDFVLIPTRNLDSRPPLSILFLAHESSLSTILSLGSRLLAFFSKDPRGLLVPLSSPVYSFTSFRISPQSPRQPKVTYRDVDAIPDSLFFPLPSPPLRVFLSSLPYLSLSHRK